MLLNFGQKNNNEDHLTRVYEKYSDMLYRIALSELQNSHDAEDAVQDVFIKFIHACPQFNDDNHERAWLIRVTINRCRDMQRAHKVREHLQLDELAEILPDESKQNAERVGHVLEVLSLLPEKIRSVVILHYLEGFAVEDIAVALKLSASAVKMRLKRGRDLMKNIMEEDNV